jgi:hypothetical protein
MLETNADASDEHVRGMFDGPSRNLGHVKVLRYKPA